MPWPPSKIWPNQKNGRHFRAVQDIKEKYKNDCYVALCASGLKRSGVYRCTDNIQLDIRFAPPTGHNRDLDNAYAAIKWGLDTLADYIEVNDRQFRPVTLDFIDIEKGGAVYITLIK